MSEWYVALEVKSLVYTGGEWLNGSMPDCNAAVPGSTPAPASPQQILSPSRLIALWDGSGHEDFMNMFRKFSSIQLQIMKQFA
jgi:hypothetical protein